MKKLWNRLNCWWRGFHRWGIYPASDTCRDCGVRRTPLTNIHD